MSKLVSMSSNIRKSINWGELDENTQKIPFIMLDNLNWGEIEELHILGNVTDELEYPNGFNIEEGVPNEKIGCYLRNDKKWLLVLGAPLRNINDYILRCSENLSMLDVRFTSVSSIDLSNAKKIFKLELHNNPNLQTIVGLSSLSNLRVFTLKNALFSGSFDLSPFSQLYSLNLRGTPLEKINLDHTLQRVMILVSSRTLMLTLLSEVAKQHIQNLYP